MKTILIVDDEPAILDVLGAVLEDEEYKVDKASNGQEGLKYLETKVPDLIICDIMMPVMDGREMCRRLNAHPRYSRIPLILMSAAGRAIAGVDCHYSAILAKPFELDEVLSIVERLVNGEEV